MSVVILGDLTTDLPAAGEVAAYRIAIEALSNSARHSGATAVSVDFDVLDDSLHVEVRDNGTSRGNWMRGVGLISTAERTQELGRTFIVEAGEVRAVYHWYLRKLEAPQYPHQVNAVLLGWDFRHARSSARA